MWWFLACHGVRRCSLSISAWGWSRMMWFSRSDVLSQAEFTNFALAEAMQHFAAGVFQTRVFIDRSFLKTMNSCSKSFRLGCIIDINRGSGSMSLLLWVRQTFSTLVQWQWCMETQLCGNSWWDMLHNVAYLQVKKSTVFEIPTCAPLHGLR